MRMRPNGLLVVASCAVVALMSDVASGVTNASDVLGFEVATDWSSTTSGITRSTSPTHTQGSSSLSVQPSNTNGWTPLFSVPLSTLGEVGSTAAIDLMLPIQQANPYWYGAVQMYINCPSHNIYTAFLAEVELTGLPLGVWHTLTFPLPAADVTSLLSSGYSDLTFEVVLNVAVPTTGKYLFDNLRFLPVGANACGGQPNGALCNDGNACTATDTCQNGVCVGSNPLVCNDNNPCTTDSCNVVAGCVHTASACGTRTGEVQAESFDSQSGGVVSTSTAVTAPTAGSWIAFNNVDFGAAGTNGAFQISIDGAPGNQNLELHVGSPTGPLVANLLTLPSDPVAPAPQTAQFLLNETGVQTVFIVFDAANEGSLDWFQLIPGHRQPVVSTFPPTFHHPAPAQPAVLTNVPIIATDDEPTENDVPVTSWFQSPTPKLIAAGSSLVLPLATPSTLTIQGQVRWAGPASALSTYLVNSQKQIIQNGTSTSVPSGARSDLITSPQPAGQYAFVVKNVGGTAVSAQIMVGAVQ